MIMLASAATKQQLVAIVDLDTVTSIVRVVRVSRKIQRNEDARQKIPLACEPFSTAASISSHIFPVPEFSGTVNPSVSFANRPPLEGCQSRARVEGVLVSLKAQPVIEAVHELQGQSMCRYATGI